MVYKRLKVEYEHIPQFVNSPFGKPMNSHEKGRFEGQFVPSTRLHPYSIWLDEAPICRNEVCVKDRM